jgi:hypothetical protein
MESDETIIITTKAHLRELADFERGAKKLVELPLPAIYKDQLVKGIAAGGAILGDYNKSREATIGSAELGEMCGTDTPAATRAMREGRVPGAANGPNGRWKAPRSGAEEYATRRGRRKP